MSDSYARIAFTDAVMAAQQHYGSRGAIARWEGQRGEVPSGAVLADELTEIERAFISEREEFYVASVSDSGWPYVQFRGGPRGFVTCPDARHVAWPDFRGNRQYITTGNLDHDSRVALIFMDYPNQLRLKVFGTAVVTDTRHDRLSVETPVVAGYAARVERLVRVEVAAYDWNCPQHITPRYSAAELRRVTAALEQRLAHLEKENVRLRRDAAAATD